MNEKANSAFDIKSAATTTTGGVALASSKSVLRLYDGKYSRPGYLKKAKTQLFGFGDPFVDVAVSRDGDWVLSASPMSRK